MTTFIDLSEDAFAALFKPKANHLKPHAAFDWGNGFGTLFETFGEELAYVQKQNANNIWTLCSGDCGDVITSGLHFVNRLGYFITEVPVPEGVQINVFDMADRETLPPRIVRHLEIILDYLWQDEEAHFFAEHDLDDFFESDVPHIYRSLSVVRIWLVYAAKSVAYVNASHRKPISTGME